MIQFRPTEADLKRLKLPLGELFPGPPSETIPNLKALIGRTRPPFITAVGDVVSQQTEAAGVPVNLLIVDHRSMRKSLHLPEYQPRTTYHVTNPAGVITQDSWNAIRKAVNQNESLILVDGEEDLLALPCIIESPDDSLVVYGQPSEGMVVVKVSLSIKARVNGILQRASREET